MRIAVSAQGDTLESPASPVFGRCPSYLFVDSETMTTEALDNPAMGQGSGAGVQAAQFVVQRGAQVVLTGNLGPNAFDVLEAAGVQAYLVPEGSVRQAVKAFQTGRLQPIDAANAAPHAGMAGGPRQDRRADTHAPIPAPPASHHARASELEALRETLRSLRRQLAETMEKIEKLEQEETH
jgi:predicted Fe-Mo cluster-binding NifX family protein